MKIAAAAAMTSAALFLAVPSASASDTQCDPATAAAMQAETAYKAALADYQATVNNGGHPGKAEQDNVDQLKQKADSTASEAQRVCGDTVMQRPSQRPDQQPRQKPTGAMHTGVGSTSQGSDDAMSYTLLGGAAVAIGATAYSMRRRSSAQGGR
jgi:hypothetical protein